MKRRSSMNVTAFCLVSSLVDRSRSEADGGWVGGDGWKYRQSDRRRTPSVSNDRYFGCICERSWKSLKISAASFCTICVMQRRANVKRC